MLKLLGKEIEVVFEVEKIYYENKETGYRIFEGNFHEYPLDTLLSTDITLVGQFPSIFKGDIFKAKGYWIKNKTYGYQFKVYSPKRVIPQSQKGLISFIQRFAKGVGLPTARKIVEKFQSHTLEIIMNDHKRLLDIKGIGSKTADKIHKSIVLNKSFEELSIFLLNYGGNYELALNVFEKYKEESILKLKLNPYIMGQIKGTSFLLVDKIGKNMDWDYNDNLRVALAILYYINYDARQKGNLYISEEDIYENFNDFIVQKSSYKKRIEVKYVKEGLEFLIENEEIVPIIHKNKKIFYLEKYLYMENKIVELLVKHLNSFKEPIATKGDIENFLVKYQDEIGLSFDIKQEEAVHKSLTEGVSVLTGGPGTGKTQTINTIIKAIKTFKPHAIVHLCAPTGKASKRMTELTGHSASTIHRLIGLNSFEKDNELEEVEGDFVIFDESSMIGAFVFWKLLEAIDKGTRLIFVGDHNQLPSVDPGLILRDLINSEKIPVTKLEKIFRQAEKSQIVTNAYKVINGNPDLTFDTTKEDFYFLEETDTLRIQALVKKSISRFLEMKYTLDDIQLLSPIKKTDVGVKQFNFILQDEFNPMDYTKMQVKSGNRFFREKDRVIHIENNYDISVFNGEVGEIVEIYKDENDDSYVTVDYPDKEEVLYEGYGMLKELNHAYALTIHKSQGSEFPIVIIVLHGKHKVALNRNILYTAMTRATDKVVIIGDKKALTYAIGQQENIKRNSLIIDKLKKSI